MQMNLSNSILAHSIIVKKVDVKAIPQIEFASKDFDAWGKFI